MPASSNKSNYASNIRKLTKHNVLVVRRPHFPNVSDESINEKHFRTQLVFINLSSVITTEKSI